MYSIVRNSFTMLSSILGIVEWDCMPSPNGAYNELLITIETRMERIINKLDRTKALYRQNIDLVTLMRYLNVRVQ